MVHSGRSRRWLARRLNTAYAGGLLSADTFAARIEAVLQSRVIDPAALVGDLNLRGAPRRRFRLGALRRRLWARLMTDRDAKGPRLPLLALDWSGAGAELLIGRHHACDIVLDDLTISRRHASLLFRDGKWIIHDLRSKNGTFVNGTRVGRSELRPGDALTLGEHDLKID